MNLLPVPRHVELGRPHGRRRPSRSVQLGAAAAARRGLRDHDRRRRHRDDRGRGSGRGVLRATRRSRSSRGCTTARCPVGDDPGLARPPGPRGDARHRARQGARRWTTLFALDRPARELEGQPDPALLGAHLRVPRPRGRVARREPDDRRGDPRRRRVLHRAPHRAGPEPELPRAHGPLAASTTSTATSPWRRPRTSPTARRRRSSPRTPSRSPSSASLLGRAAARTSRTGAS